MTYGMSVPPRRLSEGTDEEPIVIQRIAGQPAPSQPDLGKALEQSATRALNVPQTQEPEPTVTPPAPGQQAAGSSVHTPRALQLLDWAKRGEWGKLQENATPAELVKLGIVSKQWDRPRVQAGPPRDPGWVGRQRTVVQEPSMSESTKTRIDMAEKLGLDAIEAGLEEEKKASDANALAYEEQAARSADALQRLREDQLALADQRDYYLENERNEIERIASGEGNPRSLWGGVGKFGRAVARALMFLSGPQSILEAMKVDVQREEAEGRIRANAFSNLRDTYKSTDAAAAALELRRGAYLDARLKAVEARSKSANVKNRIAEARAAYYKRAAELQGKFEESIGPTITTTELWDQGTPGGVPKPGAGGMGAGGGGGTGGGGTALPRVPSQEERLEVSRQQILDLMAAGVDPNKSEYQQRRVNTRFGPRWAPTKEEGVQYRNQTMGYASLAANAQKLIALTQKLGQTTAPSERNKIWDQMRTIGVLLAKPAGRKALQAGAALTGKEGLDMDTIVGDLATGSWDIWTKSEARRIAQLNAVIEAADVAEKVIADQLSMDPTQFSNAANQPRSMVK